MLSLLIVSTIAAPAAPLYPGVGAIYKGPDSETIIKGPDGSRITSKAEGAALATEEELKPIVGPAPYVIPALPKETKIPKIEIKGPSGKVETNGKSAKVSGPASEKAFGGSKAAEEAAEEVVGIAEKAVKGAPESDAIIFALQEPQDYVFPKGKVEFEAAGPEGANAGYWGEGEEEEDEEGDDEKEEYEPFVIKEY